MADLDLSRLRLSKKDLETLSNIAPGLPKCFQEQLLAKLPPTQARKLSRTLSMQTNQNISTIKIYKRSQSSSGRNASASSEVALEGDRGEVEASISRCDKTESGIVPPLSTVRSHSRSKSNDENGKESLGLSYNSEINDKYKYYSPYVNKVSKESTLKMGQKSTASTETMLGRPPSGRLSPPPPPAVTDATVNVTRRPLQRRISRLLRPDFLDQPLEEQPSESSIPSGINQDIDKTVIDKDQLPISDTPSKLKTSCHVRNKSVELFSERSNVSSTLPQDSVKCHRRSLSRSRDLADETTTAVEKHKLADKILQELQLLSSIRSQQELGQDSTLKECLTTTTSTTTTTEHMLGETDIVKEKTISTIKKVKKVKTKEKSAESASTTDVDGKTTSTVVKKVKKIVKKSDSLSTPTGTDNNVVGSIESSETTNKIVDLYSPKKISKLKRPKSYPMKESISDSNATEMCNTSCKMSSANATVTMEACSSSVNETGNASNIAARESRLLRPKSYPSSKLATPKDVKKTIVRNKITTIDESSATAAFCAKPDPSTPSGQISEQPIAIGTKKTVKVTKKSKLSQPTAISTPVTTSNTTSSTGEDSKESSPAAASTVLPVKEKIAEKKPNKGLLYAIGQKFEKLRASATSNSCANIPINKKSSPENSSPEKITPKSAGVVKKTKSLGNSGTKSSNTSTSKVTAKPEDTVTTAAGATVGKPAKTDKRSRIDAMIRNLRERSVPRSQPAITSESNYIKRAISVEEMPGTFNRKSVNKVLGLFKRYDKDGQSENRVRSTRSTSNIEREISKSIATTPIYQNADAILKLAEKSSTSKKTCKGGVDCNCDMTLMSSTSNCPDCMGLTETKPSLAFTEPPAKIQEGNKEKRKGLMLELNKPDKAQTINQNNIRLAKKYNNCSANDNEIYSNISPYNRSFHSSSGNGSNSQQTVDTSSNNNNSSIINNNSNNNNNNSSSLHTSQTSGYRTTSSTHEINQNNNLLSPSFENIGTYSSDSRSYQEDCASTSTFLSPTEEPELCFDTWSVCSEDNYHRGQGTTPSPTVSRLSRVSQASSPTRRDGDSSEPGESVVDRIKRRSFYCRFNEKKPKRTSSIVGPNAVREYYREQSSASKSRSSNKVISGEREHSPDITQEFFRPLKLSPIGTELKPPVYRSSFGSSSNSHHDYSSLTAGRPRKSLNDIRTPTSPSCLSERRYGSFGTPENELLSNSSILPTRYKLNTYDETPRPSATTSSTYYNTYNPKRRFSFTTNGSAPSSGGNVSNTSAHIDGYATMGRRPIRAYDHRTMSLLDPPSTSYRHESSTPVRDYTTSLSR